MKVRLLIWLPLLAAAALLALFAGGLIAPHSSVVRSRMVGQPLPAFDLPPIAAGVAGLSSRDLRGRPYLLNIFASWCLPCAVEAPQLAALRRAGVAVVGIAIKDKPDDLADFLKRNGNPYLRIGSDARSAVQMALGSSGVPESFIVGADGVIRRQIVGDIHADQVAEIAAAVKAAR